ncbi:MAG: hypothetical protein MZV63_71390 [Marinilabiliales bacterium]|nr:hypothetical protein [Marinilabiliales bacterium]
MTRPALRRPGNTAPTRRCCSGSRPNTLMIGKVLEYRGLKKLLSTYVEALPELDRPQYGKDTHHIQPGCCLNGQAQLHQPEPAEHTGA